MKGNCLTLESGSGTSAALPDGFHPPLLPDSRTFHPMTSILPWLWYISYLLVLVALAGYGLHRLGIIYLYAKHSWRRPQPLKKFEDLPMVTVQLPVFNELHVVTRLLEATTKLDYPQDKLQIQVRDDSTDETTEICRKEVERFKKEGFDIELIHRDDRTGFKAGALENGTESAKGEYLFILDADFVPAPNVLKKTIH